MRQRPALAALVLAAALSLAACSGGSGSDAGATTTEAKEAATTSTTEATTTSEVPKDDRSQLTARLATELDDEPSATTIVDAMDDDTVASVKALADGDIAGSPWLSYQPTTAAPEDIDSLWVFSYGYRFAPGEEGTTGVPPMDALVPGPTNEELAQLAADFVEEHPVPIVAQWEVAQVLEDLGVEDVISVEPDVSTDGSVVYLSTTGVAEKGLRLLEDEGTDPGHAGILCFADHAVRCVLSAEDTGLQADVPEGVELPSEYDPESGQEWTRQRETWIPIDLAGRTALKG